MYEASGLNIEPCHKKPKMVKSTIFPLSDERQTKVPNCLKKAPHNFSWTSDLTFNRQSGDVGWLEFQEWSTGREHIKSSKQMNESPTPTSVVAETITESC